MSLLLGFGSGSLAATILVTLVMIGGCKATEMGRPPDARHSFTADSSECTGRSGEAVLGALFQDIGAGRHLKFESYFGPKRSLVRWWDPTVAPGAVIGSGDLFAHLKGLQSDGASLILVSFKALGYQGGQEAGGWFNFTFRGRMSDEKTRRVGSGKGAVDCKTSKLMTVVINGP